MSNVSILPADHEFTSLVHDLLDHTSSVIYVKDTSFRYLLVNRQFETLFHLSRNEILGKTDFDIFAAEQAAVFRANDARVLESGEALKFEELAIQEGEHHKYLSLKFPLRDSLGAVYAVAGISTDITDRVRDQHEIAVLNHRQQLILDSVADGICSLDADGRIVFLNPAAERMLQRTSAEARGECHSQIIVDEPHNGFASYATEPGSIVRVLSGDAKRCTQNAICRRRDGSSLPVEFTVVPIHDRGTTAGAVVTFRDTTVQLKQIETEQEIQTARRIQAALTPKGVPSIPGFEFAAMSVPCTRACGDYFDFIPLGDHCLGIAVGDVSGHGLGAALEMVETRAVLRTTMLTERDPVQCLGRINQILADDLPDDMFVSLFLAILDPVQKTLSYASAGHDALILSAGGESRRLVSTGPVLGIRRSGGFSSGGSHALHPGDVVLFATDGISESLSPTRELFGRHRILELMREHRTWSAGGIVSAIHAAAEAFREGAPQRDDMTAVVLKVI